MNLHKFFFAFSLLNFLNLKSLDIIDITEMQYYAVQNDEHKYSEVFLYQSLDHFYIDINSEIIFKFNKSCTNYEEIIKVISETEQLKDKKYKEDYTIYGEFCTYAIDSENDTFFEEITKYPFSCLKKNSRIAVVLKNQEN